MIYNGSWWFAVIQGNLWQFVWYACMHIELQWFTLDWVWFMNNNRWWFVMTNNDSQDIHRFSQNYIDSHCIESNSWRLTMIVGDLWWFTRYIELHWFTMNWVWFMVIHNDWWWFVMIHNDSQDIHRFTLGWVWFVVICNNSQLICKDNRYCHDVAMTWYHITLCQLIRNWFATDSQVIHKWFAMQTALLCE